MNTSQTDSEDDTASFLSNRGLFSPAHIASAVRRMDAYDGVVLALWTIALIAILVGLRGAF